jgi:competence protein ComEA
VRRWGRALAAALVIATAGPALAKKPLGVGERVDLNRATSEELMRLPGVGAKKAQAILARRARAPFGRVEEVTSVKGCGAKWFSRAREHLTTGAGAAGDPTSSVRAQGAAWPGR